jgi:hypothetical protein
LDGNKGSRGVDSRNILRLAFDFEIEPFKKLGNGYKIL